MRPDSHEIYARRRSRNLGLGLTLAAFVILTFAVTASGLSMAGIGSAFWGLAAGLLALALDRAALTLRSRPA